MKNFSKAAEVLGYAQSTITLQNSAAGAGIGCQSVRPHRQACAAFPKRGAPFSSYANDMVQLEAEAIETVSENTTPTGTLRIGTIESIASSFLPLLLEEYLKNVRRCIWILSSA